MNIPVRKIARTIGDLNYKYIFSAAGFIGSVFLAKKIAGVFSDNGKLNSGSVRNLLEIEKTSSDIVVIDLRSAGKFNEGHLERAFNIDYSSPHFQELISKFDKGKTYLVYSDDAGMNAEAAKSIHSIGFRNVFYPDDEFSKLEGELVVEPQI